MLIQIGNEYINLDGVVRFELTRHTAEQRGVPSCVFHLADGSKVTAKGPQVEEEIDRLLKVFSGIGQVFRVA